MRRARPSGQECPKRAAGTSEVALDNTAFLQQNYRGQHAFLETASRSAVGPARSSAHVGKHIGGTATCLKHGPFPLMGRLGRLPSEPPGAPPSFLLSRFVCIVCIVWLYRFSPIPRLPEETSSRSRKAHSRMPSFHLPNSSQFPSGPLRLSCARHPPSALREGCPRVRQWGRCGKERHTPSEKHVPHSKAQGRTFRRSTCRTGSRSSSAFPGALLSPDPWSPCHATPRPGRCCCWGACRSTSPACCR